MQWLRVCAYRNGERARVARGRKLPAGTRAAVPTPGLEELGACESDGMRAGKNAQGMSGHA
ncbi:hypothetical protein ACCUM_0925 [Candidatus Accumulibacter phosphatis]|uniref:Uncharacterized protein n=1 Tax=Candidatus Accumulibacter phosphatis TaxID=327160 RepID=A0A5S4ET96_9PROT|nr:hypothetical protein ACCUM_0925 [Candidatus Accumulibacter phosphatis]